MAINSRRLTNPAAFRSAILVILFPTFAAIGNAQSAGSPIIYEVKFQNGLYVKKGSVFVPRPCPANGPTECGNGNSTSLYVSGKKGDRIRIALKSQTGGAVFSIFFPDHSGVLEKGGAVTGWTGNLPEDGDFLITVYTYKSDTSYTLRVYNR